MVLLMTQDIDETLGVGDKQNPEKNVRDEKKHLTRRTVLKGAALATAVPLIPTLKACRGQTNTGSIPTIPSTESGSEFATKISPRINGSMVEAEIDNRMSLLDFLREKVSLTGTKKGCDHGQCGACTVHVDGRRVVSCLTLATKVDNCNVTTIEYLGLNGDLHPMQEAFIKHDALQCGYCTPGQIMAAIACINEGNATSKESIKEYMSGNICRCGAYTGIVAAIEDVAKKVGSL